MGASLFYSEVISILEKQKPYEKQAIIDAWEDGYEKDDAQSRSGQYSAEQYYTDTYGK